MDSVLESGYPSLVLDRLARQACHIMEVEQTSLVVRDPVRADAAIAVAGYGLDDDLVGSRLDASQGLTGKVLASGVPAVSEGARSQDGPAHAAAPVAWGVHVLGALSAHSTNPRKSFGARELRLLAELADIAGAALRHAERRRQQLRSARSLVSTILEAIDAGDPYTACHSQAVVDLSCALGRRLRLGGPDLLELESAALLHDLGKIAVPDPILNKPGPLDDLEEALVQRHTVWGADLLAETAGLEPVATIVRFHHERWDGTGYPDGLEGSQIPIASRIIAIADAYHAMTSDRPYRRALTCEQAAHELWAGAGSQFDPALVERFIDTTRDDESVAAEEQGRARGELLPR